MTETEDKDAFQERAIIYCRTASIAAGSPDTRNDEQEARCREWATARGYDVDCVFRDAGLGGTTTDRPGMNAMLDFLRAQRPSVAGWIVLVDGIERLARDFAVYGEALDLISEAGARVESARGMPDLRASGGMPAFGMGQP